MKSLAPEAVECGRAPGNVAPPLGTAGGRCGGLDDCRNDIVTSSAAAQLGLADPRFRGIAAARSEETTW